MKTTIKNEILGYSTVIIVSFLSALILNKFLETLFFIICHTLIRPQFKRQYHHIVQAMCRLLSAIVFFAGISVVLPKYLSLLSAISINYFICWIGEIKSTSDYYETKYITLKSKLNKKKKFNVDNCTKEELITRCKELRFSEDNTNLAIEFFINKTRQSILANKLCVGEHAITIRKLRLKKKLNKSD